MSISKIPNLLLKKLTCSQCGFYLSVGPIGVRADGQSVCGRCINWAASQSVLSARCKLYEELAALHMFPCSYESQGCSEYVCFGKAAEHENKCVYRTYRCPVSFHSACDWNGPISQISQHYKIQHPELFLKIPNLKINYTEDYEIYNLVEVNNIIFLLQTKCAPHKKKFWFNVVCVGNTENKLSISYKIKLSGETSRRVMELEDKNPLPVTHMHMVPAESVEVDVDGLLALLNYPEFIMCHWDFTIKERLKNQFETAVLENLAKCPNCNICMVPPIYRCPIGHLTCADCKGYDNKCGVCCEASLELNRAIDLEDIAYLGNFLCRWRNCCKTFSCNQIRRHEQECENRNYTCPPCGQLIGTFDKIFRHFKSEHAEIPIEMLKLDTVNFLVKTLFTYVLVHREIFKIDVITDALPKWTIHITYYGPPGLENRFKYEIRDRYNILYYASKCRRNIYKATQLTYCTSSVRAEYYLSVKFNRQSITDIWLPLDSQPKRARLSE